VRRNGFTLTEMLATIAIVALLAAFLFPVFRQAKDQAQETHCLSNHRQIAYATTLYLSDYDDRFMPARYAPGEAPNSGTDRTWVQLLLPYLREFRVFRCPGDHSARPKDEASFDRDLVPGDTFSRFYTASQRSNSAYNYLYLSPVEWLGGRWTVTPRTLGGIEDTSRMILALDSVWDRDEAGRPKGGGNLLAVPPCRYQVLDGIRFDTFPVSTSGAAVWAPSEGWDLDPKSPLRYGGAWPWHGGRLNVSQVDGSARSLALSALSSGCRLGAGWEMSIADGSVYLWDAQ